LPDWINFIKTENECGEHGLSQFLEEVFREGIQPDIWTYVYRKRLYFLWLDSMYARDDVFSDFRRETYAAMIGDFRDLDKSQLVISRKRIREILEALRPQASQFASGGSEIHVLMREAEKRRRLLPVRQLFGKIPLLLTALKPCLLMSPLSVSLYLDPGLYTFDTVIFDEASQVCTENAIGAIYRGKQLIVVGDREQLPPSDFFRATAAVPYDDGYDTEEEGQGGQGSQGGQNGQSGQAFDERGAYESILDECGSILSRLSLKWHYRSRHEHLIAYSNAMIYKDLITFPSPVVNSRDLGVEFVYVKDGIYDRSATRTNPAEAKKAAELVFECLEKYPGRSVGVVAFSEAQQMAIDEEINKLRKVNGSFERYFNNVYGIAGGAGDSTNSEGFFVKNLENVQGDERDTIIFSVGYGKDRNGKMSMYFGPLNREGGYRRLNVAITRARINVKLICSFLPEDIDIGRSEAAGVAMLKGYIDFVMNGTLPGTGGSAQEDYYSGDGTLFEREILEFIRVNGFDADFKAGCSEYKIDIAVKHPSDKAKYMLAVECDGEVYNSAVTARERDRLRYEVMSARGWKLYRVWSTAWIRNNTSEKDMLLRALRDAAAGN
ncbi:MAG: AAA domain-containing protein, partial [Eubacteriales bacterium]|nr:AAA domain-containing protein [Eubacteriales bacterium]